MELQGSGHYRVEVSFGNEPDAAQLLPPRSRDAIEVALDTPTDELAAYWHEGQRVEATATVTNHTAEPQEVTLSAAANDARARVQLPEAVTLQPGESARVPVTLEVAPRATFRSTWKCWLTVEPAPPPRERLRPCVRGAAC